MPSSSEIYPAIKINQTTDAAGATAEGLRGRRSEVDRIGPGVGAFHCLEWEGVAEQLEEEPCIPRTFSRMAHDWLTERQVRLVTELG